MGELMRLMLSGALEVLLSFALVFAVFFSAALWRDRGYYWRRFRERVRTIGPASLLFLVILFTGVVQDAHAEAVGRFAGKFELVMLTSKGQPVIRDGRQYKANRNQVDFRRPNGEVVSVPAGMVTDLASIPRLLSNAYAPDGPWAEAALPHDLCYKSKGTMIWFQRHWGTHVGAYTRADCDEILREGMVALHVGAVQRITIYEAVRFGGGKGWGK